MPYKRTNPYVSILAAVGPNDEVGAGGGLPWDRIPEDMKRYRALTIGNVVVMGRLTAESMPLKAFEGRETIIVTSKPAEVLARFGPGAGVRCAPSIPAALNSVHYEREAFLVGGARIWREGIDYANRVYITRVDHYEAAEFENLVFFPSAARLVLERDFEFVAKSATILSGGAQIQFEEYSRWVF